MRFRGYAMRLLRRNTAIGAAMVLFAASGCASAPGSDTADNASASSPSTQLVEVVGPEGETLERVSDSAGTTGPEAAPVGTTTMDERWVCRDEAAFAGLIRRQVCRRPIEIKAERAMSSFLVKEGTRPSVRY
jgi:hypothetical protein